MLTLLQPGQLYNYLTNLLKVIRHQRTTLDPASRFMLELKRRNSCMYVRRVELFAHMATYAHYGHVALRNCIHKACLKLTPQY